MRKSVIPEDSLLFDSKFDYSDAFSSALPANKKDINALKLVKAMFSSSPKWVVQMLKLRNRIVSVFGLKTPNGTQNPEQLLEEFSGNIGERIGLFEVFQSTASEMVLGENDKHLDFRLSIHLNDPIDNDLQIVTLSTIVVYHNFFGKMYFFIVKPFHVLVVPSMLRKMIKKISEGDE